MKEITDMLGADPVVKFVFGDHTVINCSCISQHAPGGGTNVAAAGGGAAVAGAYGSATGNQSRQAGADGAVRGAGDPRMTDGWWARLRKRGAVVAFATITGALAGVASLVFMIMIAGGWTP
jgi:hypothetical protein